MRSAKFGKCAEPRVLPSGGYLPLGTQIKFDSSLMRTAKYGKRENLERKKCKPQGAITDKLSTLSNTLYKYTGAVFCTLLKKFSLEKQNEKREERR
jgi:hypothetical protein